MSSLRRRATTPTDDPTRRSSCLWQQTGSGAVASRNALGSAPCARSGLGRTSGQIGGNYVYTDALPSFTLQAGPDTAKPTPAMSHARRTPDRCIQGGAASPAPRSRPHHLTASSRLRAGSRATRRAGNRGSYSREAGARPKSAPPPHPSVGDGGATLDSGPKRWRAHTKARLIERYGHRAWSSVEPRPRACDHPNLVSTGS